MISKETEVKDSPQDDSNDDSNDYSNVFVAMVRLDKLSRKKRRTKKEQQEYESLVRIFSY